MIKNFVEPINILNNNAIKNTNTMSIMNFNYRPIRNVVGKLLKEVTIHVNDCFQIAILDIGFFASKVGQVYGQSFTTEKVKIL